MCSTSARRGGASVAIHLLVSLAAVAVGPWAGEARAQTTFDWIQPGGQFEFPTNWNPVGPPGPADTARFNLNQTYVSSFAGSPTNASLSVAAGDVTFRPLLGFQGIAHTYTLTDFTGVVIDGGSATLAGNGNETLLLQVNQLLTLGGSGSGALTIQPGASMSAGSADVRDGTVTLEGTTWTNSGFVRFGNQGVGNLVIRNGGELSNTQGSIGATSLSTGHATVEDAGSTWTNIQTLGLDGVDSTLTVQAGGSVSNTDGFIGLGPGTTATVTVRDPGSTWTNSGNLSLGTSGNGTLLIQDGGSVTNTNGFLGQFVTGTGQVTVEGAGSTWTNTGGLFVGGNGTNNLGAGTVNIGLGGVVSVAGVTRLYTDGRLNLLGGTLAIGSLDSLEGAGGTFAWDTGTLNITGPAGFNTIETGIVDPTTLGPGHTLDVTHTLTVHPNVPLVLAGGAVRAGTLSLPGSSIVGVGPLDLDGTGSLSGTGLVGVPVVGTEATTVITAMGELVMGSLGAANGFDFAGTLDMTDQSVVILDADRAELGNFTVLGQSGRLTTINGAHLQPGDLLEGGGLIDGDFTNDGDVTGPATPGQFLSFNDNVDGAGNYAGNIRFFQGFSPGNSPAVVSFENVVFATTSTLIIELGGSGLGQFDRLEVAGTATLDGMLELALIDLGGGPFTPSAGDEFEIISATGGVSGTFDTTAEQLLALGGGLFFDILYGANAVTLAVAGVAGDYNLNGVVDAADYTVWRDTLGQTGTGLAADGTGPGGAPDGVVDGLDYQFWVDNFGNTSGSGSASHLAPGDSPGANYAVPEPASLGLAVLAGLVWLTLRRDGVY